MPICKSAVAECSNMLIENMKIFEFEGKVELMKWIFFHILCLLKYDFSGAHFNILSKFLKLFFHLLK